ncbi:MAG: TylF/MycF/NovP-related O-methyltransferase [Bacteroidia bacterium]
MNLKKAIYKGFNLAKRELVPQMMYLGRERKLDVHGDFVRVSSLELCANEIYAKNIQGAVAEVGVYRGDFAADISRAFPDRKLFLFDTFEGFDRKDVEIERNENFSDGSQDFSDTNVELVLLRMKNPDNCIIRKGYFPETAAEVDETFVFVSLDTDLYKPILEGLRFFYPKLATGGYIFVHDYNNAEYRGTQQAVHEFSEEFKVPYFPLSDHCGSAVFMK